MRFFSHPVSVILEVGLLAGLLLGQYPLAVAALIGWIGFAAFTAMKQAQPPTGGADIDSVSNENRVRIVPIRRLHRAIADLVASNRDNPAIKVIGGQALEEAAGLLSQAVRMLQLREELTKALNARTENERESAELEMRMATADPDEAASLKSALEARRLASAHFSTAHEGIARIDSGLRQAEAALSELKARLAVSAVQTKGLETPDAGLEETIARLKSLGSSLEESENVLKEGIS